MAGLLAKYSFAAILLAVVTEELGLPIPIDAVIVLVGSTTERSVPKLALFFTALTLASAVGASGMYTIMRCGGRPLVDRFGRYVRLGPKQIARAEALIARGGWGSIAVGRTTPGLRYATVIVCGLLKVPYLRFVTAHIAGTSVYTGALLVLGAAFGPAILDRIHLPALGGRLVWLSLLAIGIPLLAVYLGRNVRPRYPGEPSRKHRMSAVLLAGFAGTVAFTATLSATTIAAVLLGASRPPDLVADAAFLPLFTAPVLLLTCLVMAYYELVLPRIAPRGIPLLLQVSGLILLALGFLGVISLFWSFVMDAGSSYIWQNDGSAVLLGAVLGIAAYAPTAVYGRALMVAARPVLRRDAARASRKK